MEGTERNSRKPYGRKEDMDFSKTPGKVHNTG